MLSCDVVLVLHETLRFLVSKAVLSSTTIPAPSNTTAWVLLMIAHYCLALCQLPGGEVYASCIGLANEWMPGGVTSKITNCATEVPPLRLEKQYLRTWIHCPPIRVHIVASTENRGWEDWSSELEGALDGNGCSSSIFRVNSSKHW